MNSTILEVNSGSCDKKMKPAYPISNYLNGLGPDNKSPKTLSVWDKMVIYDSSCYKKEQESKEMLKRQEKNLLKQYLEAQMKNKNLSTKEELHNVARLEQKLVKQAITKERIREAKRNNWVKLQEKNSLCVNMLNKNYKSKQSFEGLTPHIQNEDSFFRVNQY